MKKNQMQKTLVVFLLVNALGLGSATAQDFTFPTWEKLKIRTDYPVYLADNLWDYINGAADSYLACDFQDLHIAEYSRGKKIVIKAEVYRHSDPLMAYGIYALERSPSYRFIDLGVQGYQEEGLVHFLKGPWYVKVVSYSDHKKTDEMVMGVARAIEQKLEGETDPPALISALPSEGLVKNDILYIVQSVFGYSFMEKAFRASYQLNEEDWYLYVFQNSPERIREMLKALAEANEFGEEIPVGETMLFTDQYNGEILLCQQDDFLLMIPLNGGEASIAESLMQSAIAELLTKGR